MRRSTSWALTALMIATAQALGWSMRTLGAPAWTYAALTAAIAAAAALHQWARALRRTLTAVCSTAWLAAGVWVIPLAVGDRFSPAAAGTALAVWVAANAAVGLARRRDRQDALAA